MIITCECGGKVATEAKQCPHCGKPGPFAPPQAKESGLGRQFLAAVVIAVIGVAILLKLMN
ncbi:MAG: hypothetical protein C0483_15900 [Pirellula sp.]|nr:hypothetical protein [Pirellula sp.]